MKNICTFIRSSLAGSHCSQLSAPTRDLARASHWSQRPTAKPVRPDSGQHRRSDNSVKASPQSQSAIMTEEAEHHPKQRVLMAIDQSAHAEYAFEFYIKNLHHPENEVIFAHSAEPPHMGSALGAAGYGFVSGSQFDQLMQQKREEVKQLRDHYIKLLHGKKIHYKVHAVEFGGNPGEAIIRIARDEKADMIVIGSRGMGMIRRTILGSVSDYVVHHAHCPVLVCHKEHAK